MDSRGRSTPPWRVLVTAVGSHSAGSVIASLQASGDVAMVAGTDTNERGTLSSAWHLDAFRRVPPATHPSFVPLMTDLCREWRIDALFALTDPEVDVLSSHHAHFARSGTTLVMGDQSAVATARDKLAVARLFEQHPTVRAIPTMAASEVEARCARPPLVVKPRRGRSSSGFRLVEERSALELIQGSGDDLIVQPYIDGVVFTVDVLPLGSGDTVALAREELVRTPHGAGVRVRVERCPELEAMSASVVKELQLRGPSCIEFIRRDEGDFLVMDVNPRFSAGVGFSVRAGFDFPVNALRAVFGQSVPTMPPVAGVVMERTAGGAVTSPDQPSRAGRGR